MATDPRDRLEREKERIKERAEDGEITAECRDRLLEYADALDDQVARHTYYDDEGDRKTLAVRTIDGYLSNLRICTDDGLSLLDCSAEDFNSLMYKMHDHDGKSKSTLARYQSAAQSFFRYHDDLRADPNEIEIFSKRSDPKYDETDMFTEEEVRALRNACPETQSTIRNRAFLELLIFTGQRISALVTLRVGDVETDVAEGPHGSRGYIYLNDEFAEEHGGLKGALQRGRKRPIFGANKYVRDHLEYNRQDADPDDWLFVGDPSHWKTDPGDHWARPTARQRLNQIKKEAGVEKPVQAHNFRHYCATVLYRDYGVDKDTIRMILGHAQDSTALEETYTHVFDQDHIEKAEEALGYREEDDRDPLTPKTCPTCGAMLEDGRRQCPHCTERFAPKETRKKPDTDGAFGDDTATVMMPPDPKDQLMAGVAAMVKESDDPKEMLNDIQDSLVETLQEAFPEQELDDPR